MNGNVWILIEISLKFVPKGPIDNNQALVTNRWQAIIWTNAQRILWCIYAALGGEELSSAGEGLHWAGKYNHLWMGWKEGDGGTD